MFRFCVKYGSGTILAALAPIACVSAQSAHRNLSVFHGGSVSGTIIDAEGIPQMGALVQLLVPNTTLTATALTDSHGHYRIADLPPGMYRVRATAALFLPAVRSKLEISTGSRAVVNLTLSTLLATSQWLPATRRSADTEDDWMWALRSSSMRPVLRVMDQGVSNPLSISTSAAEHKNVRTQGRISAESNSGAFARGGSHNVLFLERQSGSGETALVRADFSGARTPYPVAPSAEITAGWEKRMLLGGLSRSVLTYTSHPELMDSHRNNGAQTAVLRNAQRIELGDALRLDVGSAIRAFNLAGNAVTLEPFFKLAYRPADGVVIAYTFTRARGLESLEDLDRVVAAMPVAVSKDGHLLFETGRHDALSLSGQTWRKGGVALTAYRDQVKNPLLYGSGVLTSGSTDSASVLSDPTTQTFATSARHYDSTGVRLQVRQPITNAFAITAEVSDGSALRSEALKQATLGEVLAHAAVKSSLSSAIYVDGKFARTDTTIHGGYRWQPERMLTPVDSFSNTRETAYLNCRLRQSLRHLPMMPGGMEAIVDLQNLLAQGYQPFLSSDGKTLYLAQTPRVLQAGLAFTF